MSSKKVNDQGYQGAHRESRLYDSKFAKDPVWILWDLLLGLADRFHTHDNSIADLVNALYRLYTMNFSKTKKAEKRSLLYNAVQILVAEVDWRKSVFVDRTKVLQMVAGVNFTYQRIGHGAREWENSIRPSSISQFIESRSDSSLSWQDREKAIDNDICEQVDVLLSTPAVLGLTTVEENSEKPPMIKEFEARQEEYDRPIRRRLAIEDRPSRLSKGGGVILATSKGLSLPVVSTAGAGCFYADIDAAKRHPREIRNDESESREIEILIGLDEISQQNDKEHATVPRNEDIRNEENLSEPI